MCILVFRMPLHTSAHVVIGIFYNQKPCQKLDARILYLRPLLKYFNSLLDWSIFLLAKGLDTDRLDMWGTGNFGSECGAIKVGDPTLMITTSHDRTGYLPPLE